MKKVLTLCMVCRDGKVLLGMKKRGFGEGVWNGFGGKLEKGETVEEGAIRELEEESGLKASEVKKTGLIDFSFANDVSELLEVHVFKVTEFTGEPQETEEMRPQWFAHDEIPFNKMWADDELWYPYFLANKLFIGKFHFDRPASGDYQAKMLEQDISEVRSFDIL